MVRGYLARIGYEGPARPDLDTLRAIQRRHLETVPYENLDVLDRKFPMPFDTQRLYDKIVIARRGGVCYEQNFLLSDMLTRLGFSVDLLAGYVIGGSAGDFSHVLLLCHLPEGDFITDVGFGRGYLAPLRVQEEVWQSDGRYDYRLARDGERLTLERRTDSGEIRGEYNFTLTPRTREDFREMCDFLCHSPACKFTYMLVVSLERPEGRLTLRDDFWMLERPGQRTEKTPVPDRETRDRLLLEFFGLKRGAQ